MILVGIGWIIVNGPGGFGWCCYGYTTFHCLPLPIIDIQARADGSWREISKTHRLGLAAIQWILDSKPEVLIIATGWDGVVKPDAAIAKSVQCELHILRDAEAIALYNRLRGTGRRVAIHYHSTC